MQLLILTVLMIGFISANAFTTAQIRFQEDTLKHHNALRARHCAVALQLDANLNLIAQKYAEYLAAQGKFEHSNNGYGENLYMMGSSAPMTSVSATAATQSWYDEIKDYNFSNGGFSMKTGHFTQVVWKGSKKLGVGIAFSKDKRRAIVVANYQPPGNYMGQFPQNVVKAQC